jgi:hypothetical protein
VSGSTGKNGIYIRPKRPSGGRRARSTQGAGSLVTHVLDNGARSDRLNGEQFSGRIVPNRHFRMIEEPGKPRSRSLPPRS